MSETTVSNKIRIAVEGCGHGTLDAIYASIEESCRLKGWDSVDLVIVGGDFQAVRNQHDLNVTSMPQKFRKMADFHAYYSGAKKAPYLTIFIGGNHEASNHLFELYYGGWVAPNIYYLGAANVIQFGPLRIASLSGIWKGYDYHKPHYERLPYNSNDIQSIYHVREVDVRKLLAVRTQVDIGLSHDWPQEVEYAGDSTWLFRKRKDFKTDSQNGKLGSVAARECLDRLRPAHWFSAHLHTRFTAIVRHRNVDKHPPADKQSASNRHPPTQQQQKISAWQNFHVDARQADMAARDQAIQEQEARKVEEDRTGIRPTVNYTLQETFKKIHTDDSLNRSITSTETSDILPKRQHTPISNLDGAHLCRPVKRHMESFANENSTKDPNAIDIDLSEDDSERPSKLVPIKRDTPPKIQTNAKRASNDHDNQLALHDRPLSASEISLVHQPATKANPDEIDIDVSDDNENFSNSKQQTAANAADPSIMLSANLQVRNDLKDRLDQKSPSEFSEGGVKISQNTAVATSSYSSKPRAILTQDIRYLPLPATSTVDESGIKKEEDVSEDMRQKLASLSSNFAKEDAPPRSPALPFPPDITNLTTRFLALGKVDMYQEFLQLLEIDPITKADATQKQRPYTLQYDPNWLAILRVFAPELQVGGDPTDRIPRHRGDTWYQARIEEEEKWVQKHIVDTGLLEVPQNFRITAPVYDPEEKIGPNEMPREVTNPQTTQFCELIQIDNPFDISEAERDERIKNGPKPERNDGRKSSGWSNHSHHSRGGDGGSRSGGGRGGHRGGRGGRVRNRGGGQSGSGQFW